MYTHFTSYQTPERNELVVKDLNFSSKEGEDFGELEATDFCKPSVETDPKSTAGPSPHEYCMMETLTCAPCRLKNAVPIRFFHCAVMGLA